MTEQRKEEIVDNLVAVLAFTVVFLVVWQLIGPRIVGIDPVILDANIDSSSTNGWNDDVFTFDASMSNGNFVTYEWDFGDGTTMTGESVTHSWSDITVTINNPSGTVFEQDLLLSNGETQELTFETSEGEMIGDWEISLESNDPASDFTYDYDWFNYYQDSS